MLEMLHQRGVVHAARSLARDSVTVRLRRQLLGYVDQLELVSTYAHDVAWAQAARGADALAVDEHPILTAEILDDYLRGVNPQPRVFPRHRRVTDRQLALRASTQIKGARAERD